VADIDRVQLLIGLSNNLRNDNEEWRRQIYKEGFERSKRVQELLMLFEREYAALAEESDRLAQYRPKAQEQMPKVVQQGPKS
jgi:hypothetical protein